MTCRAKEVEAVGSALRQGGKLALGLGRGDVTRHRQALRAGDGVVRLHAQPVVGHLPPLVAGLRGRCGIQSLDSGSCWLLNVSGIS